MLEMIGYKGFDKDMKCRGFQYEVGNEYREDNAEICKSGFHFCEFPFDVFRYYAPAASRYATVHPRDKVHSDTGDSKKCTTTIKVEAEIGLPGIIKAGVEYIKKKVDWENEKESNTGDQSAATNTGDRSAATVDGNDSVAISVGIEGRARASIGSWIVIAEWEKDDDCKYHRIDVKSFVIDGEKLKPDTFYVLEDGKAVEYDEG